jgi:hypothetical protein
MILTYQDAIEFEKHFTFNNTSIFPGDDYSGDESFDEDDTLESDLPEDEEDEFLDDDLETDNDLREIRVNDDLGEPDPEDDDHLPEEELQ